MNDQQPSRLPTKDVSPDPVKIATPQSMSLYAKREKIHARSITGFFQSIRVYTLWLTMGLFLLMPWVTWEGRQALLFDLPNRKFYIFWWTFLPQDFFFLSWMLIMGAFGLFVVTVFAGRVFCGYVCPQTTGHAFSCGLKKSPKGSAMPASSWTRPHFPEKSWRAAPPSTAYGWIDCLCHRIQLCRLLHPHP
jgi:hypothetical protein